MGNQSYLEYIFKRFSELHEILAWLFDRIIPECVAHIFPNYILVNWMHDTEKSNFYQQPLWHRDYNMYLYLT